LPAFDTDRKFIKIDQLEVSLTGSLVLVYFELRHYAIKKKKIDIIGSNTFSAIATQVKILERAIERQPSAYRSLILKGPILLPQSPSKRKDQMAAAMLKTGRNYGSRDQSRKERGVTGVTGSDRNDGE
jgi:hypothetical protein